MFAMIIKHDMCYPFILTTFYHNSSITLVDWYGLWWLWFASLKEYVVATLGVVIYPVYYYYRLSQNCMFNQMTNCYVTAQAILICVSYLIEGNTTTVVVICSWCMIYPISSFLFKVSRGAYFCMMTCCAYSMCDIVNTPKTGIILLVELQSQSDLWIDVARLSDRMSVRRTSTFW